MSAPPIQYSGPVISPEVDWETRRHLQLLYQKLGNHTQAFEHVATQIAGISTGSTTTNIIEGGGSSGGGGGSSSFIGQGLINDQSGQVGYATAQGDNGILLILNDASPVAVSLTTDAAPFYLIITNFGAGTVTLTPSTGLLNGGASLSLLQNQTVYVACDSTNWYSSAVPVATQNTPAVAHEWLNSYNATTGAFTQRRPDYSDLTGTPTLPANTAPVAHEFLTGYNSGTGAFSAAQPAFTDISGQITTSQLPATGLSVTIITAQLTPTGTPGSMTFTNGILTAQTPAT